MRKLTASVLLILMGLVSACQDDEEFKIPTDVRFQLDMNREASTNNRLSFTHGHISLASFSFDGRREEGGDVYFTKTYEQGLFYSFDPSAPSEALTFQIPQGNYSRIEVALETYDAAPGGLVVLGNYLHTNGTHYPVRVELGSSFEIEIDARDFSGYKQIVLKQSTPATATISLDPIVWFAAMPASALENALVSVEEGESEGDVEAGSAYILINEETNEAIYEIIMTRIEQSAALIFR